MGRRKKKSEGIDKDDLLVLATCWSGTSVMLCSEVNGPVACGSTGYGSQKPWTNPMQAFRTCHLCTFNAAAIFWGAIRTTVYHDR